MKQKIIRGNVCTINCYSWKQTPVIAHVTGDRQSLYYPILS